MEKKTKLIISIMLSLALVLGGTYAAWNFLTEKTQIIVNIDGDQISYNAGAGLTVNGMMPVYSMEQGVVKEIEIYKENGDYTAGMNLYLNLTSWPSELSSSSFRYAVYKNGIYISSGDMSGKKQGDKVKITGYTQKINLEENKDLYTLYLWLDAYSESNENIMNKSFTVNLYGEVTFYDGNEVTVNEVEPNAPDLVDGMIPVRYDYKINEWVKADSTNTNNNWYSYENKIWANAVLVDSDSRSNYMNASIDTPVSEDDILAYYVWIPRYKYVLFNVNSEVIDPIEIQIEFEKETDPISQGDENGEFLSHPAFWWDNNSDGIRAVDGTEEIAGIWVGKFETGGTVSEPKVKPNVQAATGLNVYNLFNMNKNIQNTNYLTETGVIEADAHMIKNTDWGTVAYLSHSRYGINKTITINDNSNHISGRQGNYTYNDFVVSGGTITSNKKPGTGTKASTTGNVYGVYDIAGCGSEYVMGVNKSSGANHAPCYKNSGFNANNIPQLKYYNLYEYTSTSSDYTKRILGDATGETNGWYGATKKFINSSDCWFTRGGNKAYYHSGGGFYIYPYSGGGQIEHSSRGVLLKP